MSIQKKKLLEQQQQSTNTINYKLNTGKNVNLNKLKSNFNRARYLLQQCVDSDENNEALGQELVKSINELLAND